MPTIGLVLVAAVLIRVASVRATLPLNQTKQWGPIFNRPINSLTENLNQNRWPLSSQRQLYELLYSSIRVRPFVVLDIGMGTGRALLESTGWLRRLAAVHACNATSGPEMDHCRHSPAGASNCHRCISKLSCGVGITSIAYTKYIYQSWGYELPHAEQMLTMGERALFMEGKLAKATVGNLAARFHTTMGDLGLVQDETAPPVVVDADYTRGLPFPRQSFALITEQAAIKFFDRRTLPDPSRSVADYMRYLLDEVHLCACALRALRAASRSDATS